MGFRVQRKAYRLVFKGTELDGLEVTMRSLSTGQLIELEEVRLAARAPGASAAESKSKRAVEMMADALISWNAEDEDGTPLPPSMAGLMAQDIDFLNAIQDAWIAAINGVPGPLSETSSDGAPSLEESIPMDVPSPSLTS